MRIVKAGADAEHPAASHPDQPALIRLVEGDSHFRTVLSQLFSASGYDVAEYGTPAEFIERDPHARFGCLVLDVRICEVSGLDLQLELARLGITTPIVFLTDHGDIRMTVQAMRAGAVDFLTKPYQERELLSAIEQGVARDRTGKVMAKRRRSMQDRFDLLTPREREVLGNVRTGIRNRELAAMLGVTEITVKVHRAAAMRKLGLKSVVELVAAYELLEG
jgi:FixJ family two-component response regulator